MNGLHLPLAVKQKLKRKALYENRLKNLISFGNCIADVYNFLRNQRNAGYGILKPPCRPEHAHNHAI